jgi:MATE family multidrug resistance protein
MSGPFAGVADLLRLAIPIAFARSGMMAMNLTDMVILGQMRPGELAFVLNAWLPVGIALGLGIGLLGGVQVLSSELVGSGRTGETGRIFRRCIVHALGLGLGLTLIVLLLSDGLFALLGFRPDVAAGTGEVARILGYGLTAHMVAMAASYYLEALRRPGLVVAVTYGAVLINLVFDLALVAGWWGLPQMGAQGVAWATTGSRVAMALVFLLLIAAVTPGFRSSPKAPAREGQRQLAVGTGGAISNVAEWGGFNATFVIATWVSLATASAYGLAVQVLGVTFMLFLGLGMATSVRVAEAHGRGDGAGVAAAGRLGWVAGLLMGLLVAGLVFVLRDPLASGLIASHAEVDGLMVKPILVSMMALAALVVMFDGLQAVGSMALRAQDIVWSPAIIHLAAYFLVMLPACYGLAIGMERGAVGMMEGVLIASLAAGVAQVVRLEREAARRGARRAAEAVPLD